MNDFTPIRSLEHTPRFETDVCAPALVLRCPRCGESNLHHNRPHTPGVNSEETISIGFDCEHCGPLPAVLRIEQHKGWTRVYWEA